MQALKAPSSPTGGKVFAHGGGGGDGEEGGLPHPRVKYDEDKFQIALDCQHYRPEELDVKVEGSTIIITAKQVTEKHAEEEGRMKERQMLNCSRGKNCFSKLT